MNQITVRCAELKIQDDKIIHIKLFDDIEIEKKDAEDVIVALNTLTEGKEYYLLTETISHFTATAEAKEYMANTIQTTSIVANAICVKSLTIRLLINAYIKLHKPKIPTRIFNSEALATEWLKEQMDEHNRNINSGSKKKKLFTFV